MWRWAMCSLLPRRSWCFHGSAYTPSLGENLALGGVFVGISLLRSYALRRLFEHWR